VFVTFAVFELYPAAISAGKLISEPPPATALIAPAANAAAASPRYSTTALRAQDAPSDA
jgi:hypothetical protein